MSMTLPVPAAKNIVNAAFLSNPYPVYAELCQEAAIHRIHLNGPRWALVRHAECSTFLRDVRFSASGRVRALLSQLGTEGRAQYAVLERSLEMWMLLRDPPEHSRLRKLMNKGFSRVVVEGLRTQVETVVDEMLDAEAIFDAAELDIISQFAHPLPVRVIAQMLGVPASMKRQFIEWSDSIARFFGSQTSDETASAAQEAIIALTFYFRDAVAERRQHKGTDLISLLIDIEEDGEVLTEEELYAQCVQLLFGGHETTRNLIGNGLYNLLKNPAELLELRGNPNMIRAAVEELLRYESPVQFISRIAKEEMEIAGTQIRPGDSVIFFLAAANRDPRQFENPDKLNLKRLKNDHLAFGAGAHFCIGNLLARLEAQVAILKILHRFPKLGLPDKPPEWLPNFNLRGLKNLIASVT
jgi:cytochrome P450